VRQWWSPSPETWQGVEQRNVWVIKESKEEMMLGSSSSFSFTPTFRPQFLTITQKHHPINHHQQPPIFQILH